MNRRGFFSFVSAMLAAIGVRALPAEAEPVSDFYQVKGREYNPESYDVICQKYPPQSGVYSNGNAYYWDGIGPVFQPDGWWKKEIAEDIAYMLNKARTERLATIGGVQP